MNYFKKPDQPLEQTKSEKLTNYRKRTTNKIILPDGSNKELIIDDSATLPDGQNGYIDGSIHNFYINEAGDVIPENLQGMSFSHSGVIIPSPDLLATCASSFHPRKKTRNFHIGYDGSISEGEPICDVCNLRKKIFQLMLFIPAIGLLIGVFKGFGWC